MEWKQICKYTQEMRAFNRLILHQRSLLKLSTNEIDLLSRIAISEELLTSKELIHQMSSNKVILSRLIKKLIKEGYITKIENPKDERSYFLKITNEGRKVLKKDYEKIILPISVLKENMGEDDFVNFMNQISTSNKILKDYYEKGGTSEEWNFMIYFS